jgi:hypothetical protein
MAGPVDGIRVLDWTIWQEGLVAARWHRNNQNLTRPRRLAPGRRASAVDRIRDVAEAAECRREILMGAESVERDTPQLRGGFGAGDGGAKRARRNHIGAFSRDDIRQPRVQPRERVALLAQVIVSVVNGADAGGGLIYIENRCQTTANHDRTGPITTDLDSNKIPVSRGCCCIVIDGDGPGTHS